MLKSLERACSSTYDTYKISKLKCASCKVEDFVDTRLGNLCVILSDRAYFWVYAPFTTENPFLGTKLLEFNIGRGPGALKGSRMQVGYAFCY